jgi:hypothetical protein
MVGGPLVLLAAVALRAPRQEFFAVLLVMLGIAGPLWLGLAIRVVARPRARLRVSDAGLTIVDGRGRERTLLRSTVRAVRPYRLLVSAGEAGTSERRRDLVEVDGARPVWIDVDAWDADGYRQVWPALGVVPGAERTIRRWSEAAEVDPGHERRATRRRILIGVGWLAWGTSCVVMGVVL